MPTNGLLTYQSESLVLNTIVLETETRYSKFDANTDRLEIWVNLDKDAQPQIETITIAPTLPVTDCYYRVEVAAAGTDSDRVYLYEFDSAGTDTAATIAAKLAELVDSNKAVSAAASTNTIVLTAVEPGTVGVFTVTVACLDKANDTPIASQISTATTQAATGTAKFRKLAAANLVLEPSTAKTLQIKITGQWFDGTVTANVANQFGPLPITGQVKLDALRAVA